MASTYSKLKIELIGTGDQAGQWGTTTNNNLGSSSAGVYRGLEQAIVGMATISSGFVANSYTLPYTNSNDDQEFRCLVLNITASLSNPSDLIVPAIQKPYIVINSSGQTVTVKVSGQTGVAVPNGAKILLYNTGTDVGTAITYLTELKLGGNLTMPSAGSINDSNGNELIKFPSAVASAVNELTISNAATGSAPTLSATGGDTNIGITLTPKGTGTFLVTGNTTFTPTARTSGAASYFTVTTPADTGQTASTEVIGANYTAATRQWSTGALTLQRERVFAAPTYSFVGASTLTTAVNVDIATPVQGTNATITNAYALRAGASYFTNTVVADGNVTLNGGTANGVLYLNGSKVATSGSALTFDGATLGVTNASASLALSATKSADGNVAFFRRVNGTYNPGMFISLSDTINNEIIFNSTYSSGNAPSYVWQQASTERMRLDTSGNLGLGVTPSAWQSGYTVFQARNTSIFASSTTDLNFGQNVYINSGGNYTYISNGYATLYNQYLGKHFWSTAPSGTAGNAITFTQAMTLDASSNLLIGTTTATSALTVEKGANNATNGLSLVNNNGSDGNGSAVSFYGAFGAPSVTTQLLSRITGFVSDPNGTKQGILAFSTGTGGTVTERARITSGGDLLVGTTTSQDPLTVNGGATLNGGLDFSTSGTKNWQVVGNATDFYIGNQSLTRYAQLQGITTFTAWTFVSDRRIKHQIKDLHYGLDALMQIRPREFNFIKDDQFSIGFIAQELKEVIPEAVTGNEIEFADNDSPEERASKTMGVSKEMLIPVLVKAIQEQQTLITSLTARVAALEGTQP